MTKKKDDKKVGAVGSTQNTKGVKPTESVSEVDKVKGATSVQGVRGVSRVSGAGPLGAITLEQRDRLMTLVSEEAEKLAKQGIIPKSQREVVEQAVKMVIDASLIEGDEDPKKRS